MSAITVSEAVALLGISRRMMYSLAAPIGPVPCHRFGPAYLRRSARPQRCLKLKLIPVTHEPFRQRRRHELIQRRARLEAIHGKGWPIWHRLTARHRNGDVDGAHVDCRLGRGGAANLNKGGRERGQFKREGDFFHCAPFPAIQASI